MDNKIKDKITSLLNSEVEYKFDFSKKDPKNLKINKKKKKMNEIIVSWKVLKEDLKFYHEIEMIKPSVELNNQLKSKEKEIIDNGVLETENKMLDLIQETEKIITSEDDEQESKDNCIIEIRAGAGGDEAKLFTRNIFQMYLKFCEKNKWKIEMMNSRIDELGGFSFVSFFVKGRYAFETLKNESGVHRVQRIPETENKGRIQTSTVSVAILPEMSSIDTKIEDKDIRIDTYRSSGAGGQHVNTTDSAVRITHISTGIFTTSQDGRSQIENKKYALLALKSIINEKYKKDQDKKLGLIRNDAIGKSERSEKIRTYNFQQSRVTDHRINFQTNKLEDFLNGNIDDLCKKLIEYNDNLEKNISYKLSKIDLFIKEVKDDKNF